MLIVDTTKKILSDIILSETINFASLLRREEYNNLHARAEFQPNTSQWLQSGVISTSNSRRNPTVYHSSAYDIETL